MARSEIKFENLAPDVVGRIYTHLERYGFIYGKIAGPSARGAYDGVTAWSLSTAKVIIALLEQESYD